MPGVLSIYIFALELMETLRRVLWMKAKVNDDDDRYNSFSLNCCNFCIQFLIVVAIFGLKLEKNNTCILWGFEKRKTFKVF